MRTSPLLVGLMILHSQPAMADAPVSPDNARMELDRATRVSLWATNYYLIEVKSSKGAGSVLIRNLNNEAIGPSISRKDWCSAAMEGSLRVEGIVFNYAGTRDPRQTDCSHAPSERVRWAKTSHPFGTGSRNNPLVPFRTLACDLGGLASSRPWLHGGYPRFGQRIYIPKAKGIKLPDGTSHNGIFHCGDTGGLITGNHIDVFIGAVAGGESGARRVNPFPFIRSSPRYPFEAYVLPD